MQAIVNNMRLAISNEGPKMVLYSAHDTTLLSLNTALNFVNLNCLYEYFANGVSNNDTCINTYPIFASNIVVELW